MPSGLRMSSACTMVSPSQVSAGPGGCLTEVTMASKCASVSAGELPRCPATPFSCSLSKLNPDAASLPKNTGGVMVAAEGRGASTSPTDHGLHSEAVAQSSALRSRRSSARALRSAWITGQVSMDPPPGPGRAAVCPYCSVKAKLASCRISGNRIVEVSGRQGAGHPEGDGGAGLARPPRDPGPDLG